uniref:Variant surface glycoprotein n=1 Tax=Trypanosoma brucei TaxID=5691 RepID=A0A1V0G0B3_9TRYP|nr:variant surface glycoprotein [Trypanosoma brucei]
MAPKLAICAAHVITLMAFYELRSVSGAAGSDGDNTLEFNALCRLLRAAQAGLQEPQENLPKTIEDSFKSISMAAKSAYENATQMEQELKALETDAKKWPKHLPTTPAGLLARDNINATYELARKLKDAAQHSLSKRKTAIVDANKLLASAVVGTETLPIGYDDSGTFLPGADNSPVFGRTASKTKNCGGTGAGDGNNGENTGVTLVNDIICLCSITASGNKKLCGNVAGDIDSGAISYNNPNSNFKTAFTNVMAMCPKRTSKTTANELALYLAAFDNLIGRQHSRSTALGNAGQYILGYADSHSTGCTGAASQTCVNYMHQLKPTGGTGIPWRTKILNAIKKAEEEAAGASKVAQAEAALDHINATIWQTYDSAFVIPLRAEKQGEETPALLDPKKADECKQHKPKKTCEEKNCEWKAKDGKSETEGECKPKEAGTENTATTGTGEKTKEGAASEGKKCSEKKSEGECKDGCKWEGKECKDSSILLNKQFAISVVSAAFVALLF